VSPALPRLENWAAAEMFVNLTGAAAAGWLALAAAERT
jgi:hypothetical protein